MPTISELALYNHGILTLQIEILSHKMYGSPARSAAQERDLMSEKLLQVEAALAQAEGETAQVSQKPWMALFRRQLSPLATACPSRAKLSPHPSSSATAWPSSPYALSPTPHRRLGWSGMKREKRFIGKPKAGPLNLLTRPRCRSSSRGLASPCVWRRPTRRLSLSSTLVCQRARCVCRLACAIKPRKRVIMIMIVK